MITQDNINELIDLVPSLIKLRDMAPTPCENTVEWATEELKRLLDENEQHMARSTKLLEENKRVKAQAEKLYNMDHLREKDEGIERLKQSLGYERDELGYYFELSRRQAAEIERLKEQINTMYEDNPAPDLAEEVIELREKVHIIEETSEKEIHRQAKEIERLKKGIIDGHCMWTTKEVWERQAAALKEIEHHAIYLAGDDPIRKALAKLDKP